MSSSVPLLSDMRRSSSFVVTNRQLRRVLLRPAGSILVAVLVVLVLILAVTSGNDVSTSPPLSPSQQQELILQQQIARESSSHAASAAGHEFVGIAYPGMAGAPVPRGESRQSDTADTFARFANKHACAVSSLEVHRPFEPLCDTKSELLAAMSGGGRIGMDAPYMPRGCDMRWYDRDEVCGIISRFDRVLFVGDSMMRHAVGALHVLMREDLGFGAVTQWNFRVDEKQACFCDGQFDTLRCAVQGIFNSDDVAKFDLSSLKCDARTINVQNHVVTTYPPAAAELENLAQSLAAAAASSSGSDGAAGSGKPVALVYSQGHHNDLDVQATAGWLTSIERTISEALPRHVGRAQLFVTPGSAGPNMIDQDAIKHGTKALQLFEHGMVDLLAARSDIDVLGTWNATVQTTLQDGKHLDLRGNLLKIMMILNWLDRAEPAPSILAASGFKPLVPPAAKIDIKPEQPAAQLSSPPSRSPLVAASARAAAASGGGGPAQAEAKSPVTPSVADATSSDYAAPPQRD
ncbi:hypothetical protein V1514DRAFT_334995 [Lipomyces japonicus]|uniref:uncharacterized protein n=1 Tax=Lipomyces japonicus TaxID=56871 RepID=UPI0034CEEFFE